LNPSNGVGGGRTTLKVHQGSLKMFKEKGIGREEDLESKKKNQTEKEILI